MTDDDVSVADGASEDDGAREFLQRRRAINRKAAQKSRRRQKEHATRVKKQYYDAQSANTKLIYEKKVLEKTREQLMAMWTTHNADYTCLRRKSSSAPPSVQSYVEQSPTIVSAQTSSSSAQIDFDAVGQRLGRSISCPSPPPTGVVIKRLSTTSAAAAAADDDDEEAGDDDDDDEALVSYGTLDDQLYYSAGGLTELNLIDDATAADMFGSAGSSSSAAVAVAAAAAAATVLPLDPAPTAMRPAYLDTISESDWSLKLSLESAGSRPSGDDDAPAGGACVDVAQPSAALMTVSGGASSSAAAATNFVGGGQQPVGPSSVLPEIPQSVLDESELEVETAAFLADPSHESFGCTLQLEELYGPGQSGTAGLVLGRQAGDYRNMSGSATTAAMEEEPSASAGNIPVHIQNIFYNQ